MQNGEIEQQVRAFLTETFLFGQGEKLRNDSPLMGTVIDSHGVVELVVFLQDQFSITVEDEEVITDNLDSVANIVSFVAGKLARNVQI